MFYNVPKLLKLECNTTAYCGTGSSPSDGGWTCDGGGGQASPPGGLCNSGSSPAVMGNCYAGTSTHSCYFGTGAGGGTSGTTCETGTNPSSGASSS